MSNIEPRTVWECECERGTGPVWLVDAGLLLFCDPARGRVLHYDPAKGEGGGFDVGGRPSFVFPTHDGHMVYAAGRELRMIGSDEGDVLETPIEMPRGNRTGDGTVDGNGRLWFSVSNEDPDKHVGGLFRYLDERMIPTLFDMAAPCGPAITADSRLLYHVDSGTRTIYRYGMNNAAALSNSEEFLTFDADDGVPQGIVLDNEQCLWVAMADSGSLRRYSPNGALLTTVDLPCSHPVGLAFGGAGMNTLFVTSAKGEGAGESGVGGALFAFETPVGGPVIPAVKLSRGNNMGLVDDDDH